MITNRKSYLQDYFFVSFNRCILQNHLVGNPGFTLMDREVVSPISISVGVLTVLAIDFLNCQVYIFLVFVMNRYIGIQNHHP